MLERSASSLRRSGCLSHQNAKKSFQRLKVNKIRRFYSSDSPSSAVSPPKDSLPNYRTQILAAPKLIEEDLPPKQKQRWSSRFNPRPQPSQLIRVFTQLSGEKQSNQASETDSNTSKTVSDGSANDSRPAQSWPIENRRQAMLQTAALNPYSHRKVTPKSPRDLAAGFNLRSLLADYKRTDKRGLAQLGNLVETLARASLFKQAHQKLEEMQKLGYENRAVYARAQAILLICQSQARLALDTFIRWVDNFLSSGSDNNDTYQRDLATLKSIYVGIFEQLFRRGFPRLAYELSLHAEKVQINVSGASTSLMVPHLLQKLDMETVVTESITRHMKSDGQVPIETFKTLISACIGQKNYALGLRLVESLLEAKKHGGEPLHPTETRDLLFLFIVTGDIERATDLMTQMFDRGTLDDRVIGTVLDALLVRGSKAELRNWAAQEWWSRTQYSFKVYQKFFLACCKLGDIELAIREFERLAVQLDTGVTELFEYLIAALANNGLWVQARELFQLLQRSKTDLSPDILASVLHMSLYYKNMTEANEIMTLITTRKVQYNHKLYLEVMKYHSSLDDHKEVLRIFNQARAENIPITASMIAFAMRTCANLLDMDTARHLFNQAADLRLLSDSKLLRVWFYVCGKMRALSTLRSTWQIIREIPNLVIDEVVWLQVVTAFSSCGDTLGALDALSESLTSSAVALRFSILYPHAILSISPLLNYLRFLPPPTKAKLKLDWAVSYQVEPEGLHDSWSRQHETAPRLSDADRDAFAALVAEWLQTYRHTANRVVSEIDYADAKRKKFGLDAPRARKDKEYAAESEDRQRDEETEIESWESR